MKAGNKQSSKTNAFLTHLFFLWERCSLTKELDEPSPDDGSYNLRCTWLREAMRSALDWDEFGACRYQLDGSPQFVDGAEGVLGSTDEKRWRSQLRKVSGTQLRWFPRRMKWIGK